MADIFDKDYNLTSVSAGDAKTDALIKQKAKKALAGPEAFAEEQMAGVQEGAQAAAPTPESLQARNTGLGGASNPDIADALSRRASKNINFSTNQLARNAQTQSHEQSAEALQNASELTAAQHQMAGARNQFLQKQGRLIEQHQAEREKARNQVISSILGVLGTIGGAAIQMLPGLGQVAGAAKKGIDTATSAAGGGFKSAFSDNNWSMKG